MKGLGMTDEQASFERAIDADRKDWDLRRVYADYLEETGDFALANAQRWMADHQKSPENLPSGMSYAGGTPMNYHDGVWDCKLGPSHSGTCVLPKEIYAKLYDHELYVFRWWGTSRTDAERQLALALAK